MAKKYCDGIDCQYCSEKEPCIYKIANKQAEIIEEIKKITEVIMETNKVYPLQNNLRQIIQKCKEVNK